MTDDQPRRRAAAMSTDERRTAIVRAALPLLGEHGANTTTKQIAQAAGVAEGTVFRVFTDKEELLRVCVAEAFRTDHLHEAIHGLPVSRELDTRLTEIGVVFLDHFERLSDLMRTLATTGYDVRPHDPNKGRGGEPGEFLGEITQLIADVLGTDQERFRVPAQELAWMFLGQLMPMRFAQDAERDRRADVGRHVDVLLHGALAG